LNLKAKIESNLSYLSFKRLVPGAFKVNLHRPTFRRARLLSPRHSFLSVSQDVAAKAKIESKVWKAVCRISV